MLAAIEKIQEEAKPDRLVQLETLKECPRPGYEDVNRVATKPASITTCSVPTLQPD